MPILAWITRRGVQNLAQQDKKSTTYSEMADSHTHETKKIQTTIKTSRTEQLQFLFRLPVENPPSVHLFFTMQNLLHVRVARTKSPHRTSTRAGHVLTGFPLLYGSPPRREESEPYPGGRFPTLSASRAADKNILFTATRYIVFAHRQSDHGLDA